MSTSQSSSMRTPTLQPVPESLPADHTTNSKKKVSEQPTYAIFVAAAETLGYLYVLKLRQEDIVEGEHIVVITKSIEKRNLRGSQI